MNTPPFTPTPETGLLTFARACELSAQAWCTAFTGHLCMDPTLAHQFAHILMREANRRATPSPSCGREEERLREEVAGLRKENEIYYDQNNYMHDPNQRNIDIVLEQMKEIEKMKKSLAKGLNERDASFSDRLPPLAEYVAEGCEPFAIANETDPKILIEELAYILGKCRIDRPSEKFEWANAISECRVKIPKLLKTYQKAQLEALAAPSSMAQAEEQTGYGVKPSLLQMKCNGEVYEIPPEESERDYKLALKAFDDWMASEEGPDPYEGMGERHCQDAWIAALEWSRRNQP